MKKLKKSENLKRDLAKKSQKVFGGAKSSALTEPDVDNPQPSV